ncbi:MAG: formate--tetrahydrofolate ligase [Candidatus Methanomethylophilaceae archaeon]|nr:formate--tetrahydrofolate ligase [Candidatus Methanomethylophilaceae archaeon]
MKTDLEIAREAKVKPIGEIAASIGIDNDDLYPYGKHVAKIPVEALAKYDKGKKGKLILVTAITATPAGEGKTVTSIGLIQGLKKIGKNVVGALREPSLGPTFGVKGGATGGGYSQVYPMWDIDLHFTGDIHAVGAAHNLLSALVENHIRAGNELNIDPTQITLKKTMDMNCRELRNIVVGLGGGRNSGGVPHESGFLITSASEVSAILALSKDRADLRKRLAGIVVGYTFDGKAVTAGDIGAVGSMMVLLKDAINPNLVQTLEGVPVFIHGFPFANIAHGANSIIATRAAMTLGDYVVTEAGFAADLGAEKFMDIVCRQGGFSPDATVIVASVRALMTHGGGDIKNEATMTPEALVKGFCNLDKHVKNMQSYGVPVVVAINRFHNDTEECLDLIRKHCDEIGVKVAMSDVFAKGGEGGIELANTVVDVLENTKANYKPLYDLESSVEDKIKAIATNIYGADGVVFSAKAKKALANIEENGLGNLPICIAKTQASISDNPKLKGAPTGWELTVREIYVSGGAGFIVPVCGDMMLMPGLGKVPAAMGIDMDADGKIIGLK